MLIPQAPIASAASRAAIRRARPKLQMESSARQLTAAKSYRDIIFAGMATAFESAKGVTADSFSFQRTPYRCAFVGDADTSGPQRSI